MPQLIVFAPRLAVKLTAASALALGLSFAHAEVFRCADASGKIQFSDTACPADTTGSPITVKPNTVGAQEQREQVLRAENAALRAKLDEVIGAQRTPPTSAATADRLDSTACKMARRDYEVSASSSGTPAAILRARESNMYLACGMKEPARTTFNIDNGEDRLPRYTSPIAPVPAPVPPPAPMPTR